ncbi:sugar phosphate isomerase/epimerase family protein [Enterococcus ratti]
MFPLNLGICAHDLAITTKEALIQKLKRWQLSHIQIAPQKAFSIDLPCITLRLANYFGTYFQKNEIELSILGYCVNIFSENIQMRKQALDTFKHQISLCTAYQAKMITTETGSLTTGYTPKNFTEEAYQIAQNSVMQIVEEAEKFGITVAIEGGINHPLSSYQLAKRLIHEVASSNLKLILDCANFINLKKHGEQEMLVHHALEELGPHLAAVHLKDYIVKNKAIHIVPVGQGCLDFRPLLHFLKVNRPFLYATLEAIPEKDVPQVMNHLESLYQIC